MPVPAPLRDYLVGARRFIEQTHNHDVTDACRNAEELLRTARIYVRPEPRMDLAFDDAIGRVLEFHDEVDDQNTLTRKITPAIENARQIALISIDRLADALQESTPSDHAAALEMHW